MVYGCNGYYTRVKWNMEQRRSYSLYKNTPSTDRFGFPPITNQRDYSSSNDSYSMNLNLRSSKGKALLESSTHRFASKVTYPNYYAEISQQQEYAASSSSSYASRGTSNASYRKSNAADNLKCLRERSTRRATRYDTETKNGSSDSLSSEMEKVEITYSKLKTKNRLPSISSTTVDVTSTPSVASTNKNASGSCDRCDRKDHVTERCPWFKGDRDNHPDAAVGSSKKLLGATLETPRIVRNATVVSMPGDGSCLFHSLAHGYDQGRTKASTLRKDIARYAESNPTMEIADTPLKDWIRWDSNTTVSAYTKKMAISGWGGGIECAVFSRLKRVNVHIFEKVRDPSSRGYIYKQISAFDLPDKEKASARTINIIYCGSCHYNFLSIAE